MPDPLMTGIRFLLFADLMLVMGLAAFPLYALPRPAREDARIVGGLITPQPWLCGAGFLASLAGMPALTASMMGISLSEVDPAMLFEIATETDVGKAWLVRMAALAIALAAALRLDRRPPAAAFALLSAAGTVALASLAWSGHAAAGEGWAGAIHRVADALHMIAAGLWIGAIAAFLILLRPAGDAARPERLALAAHGLDRFACVGTGCVIIIAATGLINFQMIVGIAQAGRMLHSSYGYLLIAKLSLFGAMLALAALNRWRLAPALAATGGEMPERAIRHSLALEAGAAAGILALVALLGVLEP